MDKTIGSIFLICGAVFVLMSAAMGAVAFYEIITEQPYICECAQESTIKN